MPRVTDQAYLRSEQYRTPAHLTARADLHRRFSTNPYPWPRWLFDQLALAPGERVMEAGCGPGGLWRENLDRLPPGLRVTYGDFSLGMARAARHRLGGVAGFDAWQADVQALPFPDGAFDVVIANHMLYHVPDLPCAVRELARVLRPGGRLCAATNGPAHLRELYELAAGYAPWRGEGETVLSFRLDNAAEVLAPGFVRVALNRRADALWITEAQPAVDYLTSMSSIPDLAAHVAPAKLLADVQARIDAEGGFHVTKEAGVALAWKD
jgi:SAM-dependent methyltransferase